MANVRVSTGGQAIIEEMGWEISFYIRCFRLY